MHCNPVNNYQLYNEGRNDSLLIYPRMFYGTLSFQVYVIMEKLFLKINVINASAVSPNSKNAFYPKTAFCKEVKKSFLIHFCLKYQISEKPGSCYVIQHFYDKSIQFVCMSVIKQECYNDYGCPGKKKCCHVVDCYLRCVDPYVE